MLCAFVKLYQDTHDKKDNNGENLSYKNDNFEGLLNNNNLEAEDFYENIDWRINHLSRDKIMKKNNGYYYIHYVVVLLKCFFLKELSLIILYIIFLKLFHANFSYSYIILYLYEEYGNSSVFSWIQNQSWLYMSYR